MIAKPSKAALKKHYSLTSMKFNRFLLFRYMIALFFFLNLYWSIIRFSYGNTWRFFPVLLLCANVSVIVEQTGKYWRPTSQLSVTRIGYGIQIMGNLVGIGMIAVGKQSLLFPFINQNGTGILYGILVIGLIMGGIVERKAWLIEHNQDVYLTYIEKMEKSMEECKNGIRKQNV